MARHFDFPPAARSHARQRQQGRCACCGEPLDDLEEHGHHVIPNQSGDPDNVQHAWLSSGENCVVLCALCHDRVHQDGRYRSGAVAPPEYLVHSHGANRAAHRTWAMQLQQRIGTLWS